MRPRPLISIESKTDGKLEEREPFLRSIHEREDTRRSHRDVQTKTLKLTRHCHTGPTIVEQRETVAATEPAMRGRETMQRRTRRAIMQQGNQYTLPISQQNVDDRECKTTVPFHTIYQSTCVYACNCVSARETEERCACIVRFYSADNVFVYSGRVLENRRRIMVLVYVHQYLDSSRKPNQNGSRICWTIGGNRKWSRAKIVQRFSRTT